VNTESLIIFLFIGIVAGFLAGKIMRGSGFGLLGDLVVGIIGAFFGGWLFSALGVGTGGGILGSIIVATIGAMLLLFLIRLIKRA
jgi:uncharacterized membrane protein YeaQ/YmgE (transglycosylase-associated protein family)